MHTCSFASLLTILADLGFYTRLAPNILYGTADINEFKDIQVKLNSTFPTSVLIRERNRNSKLSYEYLEQANFLLIFRASFIERNKWWPQDILLKYYQPCEPNPLEMFARTESKSYFDKVKHAIGVQNKSELDNLISEWENRKITIPRWNHWKLDIKNLLGYENLCTRE